MAKKDIIDEHVSVSQSKKAISALLGHATKVAEQKEETELISGKEENIWLVLSVKKTSAEKKLKPSKMSVNTHIHLHALFFFLHRLSV